MTSSLHTAASASGPSILLACARTPLCPLACVYFWDKELCKHQFTNQRGHYCPGPRAWASYPVRHFVSAILFARYLAGYFDLDALRSLRYLFVRTFQPDTRRRLCKSSRSFRHASRGKKRENFRTTLHPCPVRSSEILGDGWEAGNDDLRAVIREHRS